MPEILQNRIKVIIISILLSILCLTMGCAADSNRGTNDTMIESEDGEKMENLIKTISEILGCSEQTAQSVYEMIEKHVDGNIVKVSKESENVRVRLKIIDDSENVYIAVIGRGYVVDAIYRGSEDGERIYRMIK